MAGLAALGLLTVIAGVLSGHSTINYVLTRDAREAALSWAGEIDKGLSERGLPAARLLDKDVQVVDAAQFRADVTDQAGKPTSLPPTSTSSDGFNLVENFNRMTGGWVLGHIKQSKDEFVSKLDGFALLTPDQAPLAVAGNLSPASLKDMLGHGDAAASLAQSVKANAVETAEMQGGAMSASLSSPCPKAARFPASTLLPSTNRPPPRSSISRSPSLP